MPLRTKLLPGALAVLLAAGACSSKPPAPPPVSADVWAVVDGRQIKRETVEKAYRRAADPAVKPSAEESMTAKISLLNELITQDLLLAKAKALGVEATAAEVDTAYTDRKKNITEDAFQKQLAQRGLTPDDMKEEVRRELTTQKLMEHEVASKVAVSDQAVTDFYNANRAQFNLNENAFRIAQIVVTPGRDNQLSNRLNDDATTPEAAAQKIKMIADKLKSGAHFSELAMDYSEDPQTAPQGGDLGLVSASQLQQVSAPLRDAVLKTQPGGVTQVNAGGAYTLVLVIAKEPAGQRDLTTPGVRDNIMTMLRDRQQQLRQAAFLSLLRDDARIVNHLAKQVLEQAPKAPAALAPASPPGRNVP